MNDNEIFSEDYQMENGTNFRNTNNNTPLVDQEQSLIENQINDDDAHYNISKPMRKILRARILSE